MQMNLSALLPSLKQIITLINLYEFLVSTTHREELKKKKTVIYHLFLAFTVHEYHSCYFHVEKTMIIIPEIFNHG